MREDTSDKVSQLRQGVKHSDAGPSIEELEEMVADGVAEAVDGCFVEPDGVCQHGSPSWLIAKGLI